MAKKEMLTLYFGNCVSVTNGEDFKVIHKPRTDYVPLMYNTLFECYQNPSRIKESIYEDWCRFFSTATNRLHSCGVISYNSMMFTFGADFQLMYYGKIERCHAYITKTRQEIYIYDL